VLELVLVLALELRFSTGVQSAVVTNAYDPNPGSLRAVISSANPGDNIDFEVGRWFSVLRRLPQQPQQQRSSLKADSNFKKKKKKRDSGYMAL